VSRSCQSVRTVSTHDASRGGSGKRRRARCAVVTTVWVCRLEVPLNEQFELEYQAGIVLLLVTCFRVYVTLSYYCSSQGTGVIHINFSSENNKVLLSSFPISF
jgi:hypothetical protein